MTSLENLTPVSSFRKQAFYRFDLVDVRRIAKPKRCPRR